MMHHHYNFELARLIGFIFWTIIILWGLGLLFLMPTKKRKRRELLDLLKKKYVSGEISTIEYKERKDILEKE
jgi:putative membrane protein